MDHLTRSRPAFQQIVDKQRVAHFRLLHSNTTRSEAERGHYQRSLQPVPLNQVELPRLPLVRLIGDTDSSRFVMLGEIAQQAGQVVLMDVATGALRTEQSDRLEIVLPTDL